MKKLLFALPALFLLSCGQKAENTNTDSAGTNPVKTEAQTNINAHLVQATLWYEHSGEMKALYYQSYRLAKMMFDEKLAAWKKLPANKKKAHPAVIVDIDETVLDNSPFEGDLILNNLGYKDSLWNAWVNFSKANALPGAVDFLNYAAGKGAEVFYISNRKADQEDATLGNLKNDGFPFTGDKTHLYFRTSSSGKQARRDSVSAKCDILLLCGDNLSDLSDAFDGRETSDRMDSVQKYKDRFGDDFIVLPNPMYGDWEKTFFGKAHLDDRQRDSARKANIVGYRK